jgi:hypothetical protein
VKTKIIEAVQSKAVPGNWGKFMVMVPEEEWAYRSQVSTEFSGALLSALGWTWQHVWVLDLQTGEGAFFKAGGYPKADLDKHAIWVCPLFEPFLEWLYARWRETGTLDLDALPEVVELPDAEFALRGYRRPGPEATRP